MERASYKCFFKKITDKMEDHGGMNLYVYSIISELEGQMSRLTRNTELPELGLKLL